MLYHQVSGISGALSHRAQHNKLVRSSVRLMRDCASWVRLEYLLLLFLAPAALAQNPQNFTTNGTFTVPARVHTITVEATGGAGGTASGSTAKLGARINATLKVVPGEVLYVYVGTAGADGIAGGQAIGGQNGGGTGYNNQGGGGGATDLRRSIITTTDKTGDYLSGRNAMLVAAGGGGGGGAAAGGAAGMPAGGGNGGATTGGLGGGGATRDAVGAGGGVTGVGIGASGNQGSGGNGGTFSAGAGGGGGGGGGYYGGGGGSNNAAAQAGGGGGASWVMEGAITATSASTASAGSMSITSNVTPLPVVLVRFTATTMSPNAVQLAWSTASEQHNASFAVERSTDGKGFTSLATLKAVGTSSSPSVYGWVDAQLPTTHGMLYYRLRQTDLDATVTYSPVRTVTPTTSRPTSQIHAYPNPAHDVVSVKVSGLVITAPVKEYQVFDLQGRLVRTQATPAAGTEVVLPLSGLPVGTYLLRYGSMVQHLAVE